MSRPSDFGWTQGEGTARRARGPPVRYRDKPDPIPQTLKPEWKTFLTPAARLKNEERLSRSEQRTGNKPKPPLDRKSPIQVRNPSSSRQKVAANRSKFGIPAPVASVPHPRRLGLEPLDAWPVVSKEITDTVTDTHGFRFGTGPVEGATPRRHHQAEVDGFSLAPALRFDATRFSSTAQIHIRVA